MKAYVIAFLFLANLTSSFAFGDNLSDGREAVEALRMRSILKTELCSDSVKMEYTAEELAEYLKVTADDLFKFYLSIEKNDFETSTKARVLSVSIDGIYTSLMFGSGALKARNDFCKLTSENTFMNRFDTEKSSSATTQTKSAVH